MGFPIEPLEIGAYGGRFHMKGLGYLFRCLAVNEQPKNLSFSSRHRWLVGANLV